MAAIHRAAEIHAVALRHDAINPDHTAKPRMMPIENFQELGPVGVLKPCCTTPCAHTARWVICRLRRRRPFFPAEPPRRGRPRQLTRKARARPPQPWRQKTPCTNIETGSPLGGRPIRKGKNPAQRLLKARILLKADVSEAGEGWSDSRIIKALETSPSMVYRVRKQLVEEGFEAVLSRKQRATPAVARIFDGEKEAKLIALACSQPPKGRARWTLRLLENKVVELHIVDRASDSTIGRALKKTFSGPIAASAGSSRPRPTARS